MTDRQTNRQTELDHATPPVTIGCIYIVLRCGLKYNLLAGAFVRFAEYRTGRVGALAGHVEVRLPLSLTIHIAIPR